MRRAHKLIIFVAVVLAIAFLVYFNWGAQGSSNANSSSNAQAAAQQKETVPSPTPTPSQPLVEYFSSSADKIVLKTGTQTLYTNRPTTTISYSAVDKSGNPVHFRSSDKAFVRILGVTGVFTNNTEIFHPKSNGTENDTVFSGEISISKPGVYLVKVCLGPSINLNSDGVMVWPFGCYEDTTSVQMNVYQGA